MTAWPQTMRKANVASYLDMSEAAFLREVAAGFMLGGREHWRKDAIDAAIAVLNGEGNVPDYRRELQERHGKAA